MRLKLFFILCFSLFFVGKASFDTAIAKDLDFIYCCNNTCYPNNNTQGCEVDCCVACMKKYAPLCKLTVSCNKNYPDICYITYSSQKACETELAKKHCSDSTQNNKMCFTEYPLNGNASESFGKEE